MKAHMGSALALGLLSTAANPGAAFGQTTDAQPAATSTVEAVVVTARRREEVLTDVPVTVNVVGGEQLFSQRLNDLADLSKTLPNVYFASDMASRARISIRGVGPDFTGLQGPGVGFYIDGVYQNSTAALNVPFFDLERVEILKGPQGTLYGRNALAGVINYITPKPGNVVKAGVQGELANFNTYRIAAAVGGPIVEDRLYGRLSVQHAQSDGPWKYALSGEDLAPTKFDSVRGRVVLDATERLEFDLTASVYKFEGAALPFTNVVDLQHLAERFIVNPPNVSSNKAYDLNLSTTYDFTSVELLSRTSYYRFRNISDVDSDLGGADLLRAKSNTPRRVFSEEIRLQSTGDGPFQWLVGGAYVNEKLNTDSAQYGRFIENLFRTPGAEFVTVVDSKAEIWSAFVDLTYDVTDRLELGAGLRYDTIDSSRRTPTFLGLNGTRTPLGVVFQTLKEEELQPKFTARYEFSDQLAGFATAAKGFRQGGFNPLSAGTPFATYDGDLLWNYEAGLKWRNEGGRASANLSAFYIDWERATGSAILPSASGAPASGSAVFGSARSYGVEVDGQVVLNPYLSLSGSAGLQKCEYIDVLPTARSSIRNGGDCVDTSKWNFRAELSFEYPLSGGGDFFAKMSVAGRGDTRIGLDVQDRDDRQVQKSYYLTGASLGVKKANWQLVAYVDNLFDEQYATTIYTKEAVAAFGAQEDAVVLGQPRTFGVRVRYDY